jgi:Cu(I)/Ag(I) efflux system membrane fusion protein
MKKTFEIMLALPFAISLVANTHLFSSTSLSKEKQVLGISSAHAEEAAAVRYTCPMHPQVISDKPGKCPICGMDLVPIGGGHSHEAGQMPAVEITAGDIQKMGVRTEKVSRATFGESLRATGIIMPNERTRVDLFSQVEGRVEGLKYSVVGDRVKKGALFYTLVSSDLTTLQNDYIAALEGNLPDLAASVRKRMKLLGVDDQVIAHLTKTQKPYDKVPFFIPADGVIAKLEIRNGHYLKAGDEIGHIQNLSELWVEASVPEKDIGTIKVGDIAKITFSGVTNEYTGKVDYLYPTVEPEARIAKVRLIIPNKDGNLRPEGYTTVTFTASTSERLTIPSEAILRDSSGEHVILALGEGKFSPRKVTTGLTSGGRTEILSGLKEGEAIVTSSQFLIDSESSLRESLNNMQTPETSAQGGGHAGH